MLEFDEGYLSFRCSGYGLRDAGLEFGLEGSGDGSFVFKVQGLGSRVLEYLKGVLLGAEVPERKGRACQVRFERLEVRVWGLGVRFFGLGFRF